MSRKIKESRLSGEDAKTEAARLQAQIDQLQEQGAVF